MRVAHRLESDCSNSGCLQRESPKNLVIVQSLELDVSAGLTFQSIFEYVLESQRNRLQYQ